MVFEWLSSSDARVIGSPGKEGAEEERRARFLAAGGTTFQVADGPGEGGEAETRLGDAADEGLGGGGGPFFRLGTGPLDAVVIGHALDHELGVGPGHSAAKGADTGPQRADVHLAFSWAVQRGRADSRAWT